MDFGNVKSLHIPEGEVKNIACNGTVLWHCGYALGELAPGSIVYLLESSGYEPYVVVAHDHHGLGLTTLMRRNVNGYSSFRNSTPSSAYQNQYIASKLKSAMENMYTALPESTKSMMSRVILPVREYASSDSGQVFLEVYYFPLSDIELTGEGSSFEGEHIAYFDSDELRVATDGTTAQAYWTRTVTPGMTEYAKAINASGYAGNASVTANRYLRPACCIASDVFVTEDSGLFFLDAEDQIEDGTGETQDVIIPEMTLLAEDAWSLDVWRVSNVPCTFVEGQNYIVVCNGDSYHCVAALSQSGTCVLVGSENDDTYPFCIQALNENGFLLLVRDSEESVTIAVYSNNDSTGGDPGGDDSGGNEGNEGGGGIEDGDGDLGEVENVAELNLTETDAIMDGRWMIDPPHQLVEGDTYLVFYNSSAHTCVATRTQNSDGNEVVYIGSLETGMEYPFVIQNISDHTWYIMLFDGSTSANFMIFRALS